MADGSFGLGMPFFRGDGADAGFSQRDEKILDTAERAI
jgi:hypothetical protein